METGPNVYDDSIDRTVAQDGLRRFVRGGVAWVRVTRVETPDDLNTYKQNEIDRVTRGIVDPIVRERVADAVKANIDAEVLRPTQSIEE